MSVRSDEVFLQHILEEIAFLQVHGRDLSYNEFLNDDVFRRAVVRSLEVIGEATKNLSPELRQRYPEVDWQRIAGLRDVLIHHYFGVDWPTVWNVVTEKIPTLEEHLYAILRQEAER